MDKFKLYWNSPIRKKGKWPRSALLIAPFGALGLPLLFSIEEIVSNDFTRGLEILFGFGIIAYFWGIVGLLILIGPILKINKRITGVKLVLLGVILGPILMQTISYSMQVIGLFYPDDLPKPIASLLIGPYLFSPFFEFTFNFLGFLNSAICGAGVAGLFWILVKRNKTNYELVGK